MSAFPLITSGLPPTADVTQSIGLRPLLTQSGHLRHADAVQGSGNGAAVYSCGSAVPEGDREDMLGSRESARKLVRGGVTHIRDLGPSFVDLI